MRKALIGLIMAATVMTPIAAEAQNRDRGERGRARAERSEARGERRVERAERRVERQEVRQEARVQRQETRQQAQIQRRQQPVEVVQRRSDRRSGASRPGSAYPQAWQGNPNDPRRDHYERLERQNQWRYGTREQRQEIRQERRGDRRDWRDDRRDDRRDWRNDRRGWNHGWRNDNRYDWQNWRFRNRNVFRGSRYFSPYRNHRYSRFSIGLLLEPLFYSQRYWIGDPWQYRLPAAPYGAQWVRYYNDVLLVDTYTGEVIDVIYDFFW